MNNILNFRTVPGKVVSDAQSRLFDVAMQMSFIEKIASQTDWKETFTDHEIAATFRAFRKEIYGVADTLGEII